MDKLEPLEFDRQPLEMKLKKRSSKRTMKKHKLVSGITKKDRMDLKKWEKKIIALNKKINEQIKNKKSCRKQPLAVTFEKAKRMKLSRKKRGARKPKATADGVAAAATGAATGAVADAVADAAEETPVQEETPTPTPTENTPVENSTPEESKEEKSESEESPASAPEPNESTPKEETPKEEESGSVLSSVTEGVKSAAESVGLTSKPEEEKTVGGRAKKGKGKKGKKGKWV